MGLRFPSPLGLAAGFDRRGALVGRAARLGLGAVEIGSLSAGSRELAHALQALRRRSDTPAAVHGVSLVKHPATPWSQAPVEIIAALRRLQGLADYLTLNPGRDCPDPALFAALLAELARERDRLAKAGARRLPLVAKLPARWLAGDPGSVSARVVACGADGLLLSAEGLSQDEALDQLRRVSRAVGRQICLMSVGGVTRPEDVRRRLAAGATLVQVHSALRRSTRHEWLQRAVGAGSGREHGSAQRPSRPEAAPAASR